MTFSGLIRMVLQVEDITAGQSDTLKRRCLDRIDKVIETVTSYE